MSYRGQRQGCYGNIRRLQRVHARRSSRAKKTDESLRAPIAKTPEQWLRQPNRFDIPNVDTPKEDTQQKQNQERTRQQANFEAHHASTLRPSNLNEVRRRLAVHKLYGVTH